MFKNEFHALDISQIPIAFGRREKTKRTNKSEVSWFKKVIVFLYLSLKSASQKFATDWEKAGRIQQQIEQRKDEVRRQHPMVTRNYLS
jgi:hypothetical protein